MRLFTLLLGLVLGAILVVNSSAQDKEKPRKERPKGTFGTITAVADDGTITVESRGRRGEEPQTFKFKVVKEGDKKTKITKRTGFGPDAKVEDASLADLKEKVRVMIQPQGEKDKTLDAAVITITT